MQRYQIRKFNKDQLSKMAATIMLQSYMGLCRVMFMFINNSKLHCVLNNISEFVWLRFKIFIEDDTVFQYSLAALVY